jgi:hypothetical protein
VEGMGYGRNAVGPLTVTPPRPGVVRLTFGHRNAQSGSDVPDVQEIPDMSSRW